MKVKRPYFRQFFKLCHSIQCSENFSKPPHHVGLVTSKNNITGSLSEKNFLKLDVCVKLHESKNALFLTIF